ncbi:MAG: thiol-disulfide isomerase/thioredoxin [Neolewinella sp.]|jgi:thiol-disulfide isomerase/thioredoxin
MFKHFFLPLVMLCFTGSLMAQKNFPTPDLITVDQRPVALSEYVGNGKPTIIAIWATWCQPCHMELDHMKSYLDKWENKYGAQFLAISIDKRYMMNRIKPLVSRKGWKYNILIDTNGQLQEALGFQSIPQMYILDGTGEIVQQFSRYENGQEAKIDRLMKRLASK